MKKVFLALLICVSGFAADTLPLLAIEPDEQILLKLAEVFKGKNPEYYERKIKRVGDNTIQFDGYISIDADRKIAPKILSDISKYNDWALTNINKAPGSTRNYILKIFQFIWDPTEPKMLRPEFMIDLPGFRKVSSRKFNTTIQQSGDIFTLMGEAPDDPTSYIERAVCLLKMFPTPNVSDRVWLYLSARVKLRYWLLYEALPTKLLEKESMERIQVVLDNYSTQEEKLKKSK